MAKAGLASLTFDKDIFPRTNKSQKTIDTYTEAMLAGAKFPPLEVQRVSNYFDREEAILILDGVHRYDAYQEYNKNPETEKITIVEVIEWQPDIVLDYVEHKLELRLEAADRNTLHGDRLGEKDKKATARWIANADPDHEWTQEVLAHKLHTPQQTISDWIKDIRARQKASRDSQIIRLNKLGWAQVEIGELVGLAQNRIAEIIGSTDFGKTDTFLQQGHDMEWIADHYHIDLTLTWTLRLDGKNDIERVGEDGLNLKIKPYDYWTFSGCNDLFGTDEYPGRIPGQLVAHVLYFYTEQGDVVLDPMAGGGTTPDVCLVLGRKCFAYDMAETERADIMQHDLANGWPDKIKKADLIFLDPPYFSKKDKDYVEGSISGWEREEYLAFFAARLREARDLVKKGTKLAFLMSDWNDETGEQEGIFIWDYAQIIQEAGWKLVRHIQVPLSTQQVHPDIVVKFRAAKRLARLERYLLIAEA